jgi:uncharacterized OsmC-like protein
MPENDKQQSPVTVSIGSMGYEADIIAGRHTLRADEPGSAGGNDSGPDPYGFLLAALGACKVMTMRMYADRKQWPLSGAEARLTHSKVHADDCRDCETSEGHVDVIEVQIELQGELTGEQKQRLLEIADRCPVHRTLMSETKVRSKLAEE